MAPRARKPYVRKAGTRAKNGADGYREKWTWDSVAWGTHCVDCYPGACPWRMYVRDGKIVREEQAGNLVPVIEGIPDANPMGCQKGASWTTTLYGEERVLYPLRRAGERGEGKWERVSWEEALGDIAEHILDAIEESGPETIIHEMTPAEGGTMSMWPTQRLLVGLLGGVATDVNAVINDFQPGHYITWGKFNPVGGPGSQWYSKLRLIWHCNPIYTQIPNYHGVAAARYQGCEVIHIAPDPGPSSIHADYFYPVRAGTDAALALAMCRTIIEEGIYNERFVKEQTDLPLLLRLDTKRFLRESDLEEDGSDEQFYAWDSVKGRMVPASRTTLKWGEVDPALDGRHRVQLKDGSRATVAPVFAVLRERLNREYTPEQAQEICGMNAEAIRYIARKAASVPTSIFMGMNLCKYYHGDLVQRAMLLFLALTANWGRLGGGIGSWTPGAGLEGQGIFGMKAKPGLAETRRILRMRAEAQEGMNRLGEALRGDDTEEMAGIKGIVQAARSGMTGMIPPAFFWYYHCGYRERWNNPEWGDPAMRRSFDEYLEEAVEKGWWEGVIKPDPDTPPRVLFEVGGNMLRRQRGGRTHLLEHLWPKLDCIVSVDWRMSTTGRFSDYVLPASQHYEKPNFHLASGAMLQMKFSDSAVKPEGQSLSEYEIFGRLAREIEKRAKKRGLDEYTDSSGRLHSLEDLHYRMTLGIEDPDDLVAEWVRDSVEAGNLAKGESLKTMRQKGHADFLKRSSRGVYGLNQATDIEPGKPYTSLMWHVNKGLPYPTLTRRAQFYIDHDWFLEGGEELPVHKENPKMGGDYPFVMTSGHNRWSIHSMNITSRMILNTHRGRPHLVMSPLDAAERGIVDEEEVRVYNDAGDFLVPVKLSPSVMPGQVICYNGWDPYQFREWRGPMDVEPGMVKWLHMAGGYGHLNYWPVQWQPVPADRAVRVEVEKVAEKARARAPRP